MRSYPLTTTVRMGQPFLTRTGGLRENESITRNDIITIIGREIKTSDLYLHIYTDYAAHLNF